MLAQTSSNWMKEHVWTILFNQRWSRTSSRKSIKHVNGERSWVRRSKRPTNRYCPVQKFRTTSDVPPSWNIIVLSVQHERAENLLCILHDLLVLARRSHNQVSIEASRWSWAAFFSYQRESLKIYKKKLFLSEVQRDRIVTLKDENYFVHQTPMRMGCIMTVTSLNLVLMWTRRRHGFQR